eukprot:TRINITY_DN90773_c0_g1_i1.p1 TRINITY_DN90773_c0_g1~~TRINITY_DN90773_c0_g1_i1.p1  ORF type:complete len:142 (-),score=16.18 TRINITY_DN90773_c0_g1_i1:393-818(-)
MVLGHDWTNKESTDSRPLMKYEQLAGQSTHPAAKLHNVSTEDGERSTTTLAPSEARSILSEHTAWPSGGYAFDDGWDSDPDESDQEVFSKSFALRIGSSTCYQQHQHPGFDYGKTFMLLSICSRAISRLGRRDRKWGKVSL